MAIVIVTAAIADAGVGASGDGEQIDSLPVMPPTSPGWVCCGGERASGCKLAAAVGVSGDSRG